ncbi:MAG TPA: AAA family ATPase [Steroidobacteraceae bacterium]
MIHLLERDEQLRQLDHAFGLAQAGRGRIVAISAEAGAGKTALVERFASSHAKGAVVHWGACENLSTPEVLLPLRDIARAAGETLDTSTDHIRLFEWLLRLLERGSPSILVIEDLHWADTATLDLLRFLSRRIGRIRTLLLITYRTEERAAQSSIRHLLGEAMQGSVERMALAPLSLSAVKTLAAKSSRSAEEIFALTAGNAFMVTETLAAPLDVLSDAIQDATLARVSRLSPLAQQVIDAVSIFPRHADTSIVGELVPTALDTAFDECIDGGMLVLSGGIVRFRHELARQAVERSIAPAQRQRLHASVVNELQRRSKARASEMAHHAERAGDTGALVRYSQIAGEDAARSGAPREAASHYALMLRYREQLEPESLVTTLEAHAEQSYLMGDSGAAMISMSEAAERRRNEGNTVAYGRNLTRLTRFAWLCGLRTEAERNASEAIRVLSAQPPGPELAWAFSHQSQLDMLAFRTASALKWGADALTLAKKLGEDEIVVHALSNIGTARAEMDDAVRSDELEQSFDLALSRGLHDHVERSACNLTCVFYWRRDYPSALWHIERGAAYATARELVHWEAYLRGWRAMIRLDRGEWSAAEEEAQEISSRGYVADAYRFPALIALARLRCRRGDPDDGVPLETAQRKESTLEELQRLIYVAVIEAERLWLSADAKEARADQDRVLALLKRVRELAAERQVRWIEECAALWLYLLGDGSFEASNLSMPFRAHCAGQWQEAAEAWRALGHPYEQALALGEGNEAAQREALDILDRLGAAPAAAKLRREMRARGARSVPRGPIAETRANAAGLTRRQIDVLELLSAGMTNPEIAERLCISGKTAEHHVSAILARFDAASRKEAVVAARHAGLLGIKK